MGLCVAVAVLVAAVVVSISLFGYAFCPLVLFFCAGVQSVYENRGIIVTASLSRRRALPLLDAIRSVALIPLWIARPSDRGAADE